MVLQVRKTDSKRLNNMAKVTSLVIGRANSEPVTLAYTTLQTNWRGKRL